MNEEHQMQVQVIGQGVPLVLVGGGLTGWKSWEVHADLLAAHRRVARAQLLSVQYGLEDRPLPPGYSVRMESDALGAALDGLSWSAPLDIVAWSYGALCTLDFALGHPQRVRSLALIEPPATWALPEGGRGDAELQALRELLATISDEVTADELERFVRAVGLCPPGAAPAQLPHWPSWMAHRRSLRNRTSAQDHRDDAARLRAFDRPVLLVTGTGTAAFLRRIHDTLAALLPRAQTLELPAGHAPHLVSPQAFLEQLARFQAGVQ